MLDTLFGWESIFVFTAALSATVLAWAAIALPETRKFSAAPSARSHFRADLGALAASPRFFGYALCARARLGAVLRFLGGGPHVIMTMLGRTAPPNTACGSSFRRSDSWPAISRYRG